MGDREKWLAERRLGIGGSDAPAVMGWSPWAGPLEVYWDKLGLAPPVEENEAMRWGTLLEPVIREEYVRRTGRLVAFQPNLSVASAKYPFMRTSPDGVVAGEPDLPGAVLQCKAVRSDEGWGEPGSDEIPEVYLIQVQHEMVVLQQPVAAVAVLIGGQDFRIYEVPADRELQEMIIEAEELFWRCVQEQREPEPDFSRETLRRTLARMRPTHTGTLSKADDSDEAFRVVVQEAAVNEKAYKEMGSLAKSHLIWRMRGGDAMVFADGTVLRRKVIKKAAYEVAATEYVDTRFVKGA